MHSLVSAFRVTSYGSFTAFSASQSCCPSGQRSRSASSLWCYSFGRSSGCSYFGRVLAPFSLLCFSHLRSSLRSSPSTSFLVGLRCLFTSDYCFTASSLVLYISDHLVSTLHENPPNQSMKPTAPLRENFNGFATD